MILCLIVSSTLFFLSPPLQPRRWKGEVSSDVPSLLVVYHNNGSGIISIDKEQRKKKKKEKRETADVLVIWFSFRFIQCVSRPSLHPFCPAEINWRKRRKFSRCMTFPSLLDARHSIYPITKDASMLLVEKGYCSLNIHLARWDDIFFLFFDKKRDESVSISCGEPGVGEDSYFMDWCQFRYCSL